MAADDAAILARLYARIEGRKSADPQSSYVAGLFAKGRHKIAQKLGEEAVETALAAVDPQKDRAALIGESADLLFHLLVLWADAGIKPDEVYRALEAREGVSGIAEKRNR